MWLCTALLITPLDKENLFNACTCCTFPYSFATEKYILKFCNFRWACQTLWMVLTPPPTRSPRAAKSVPEGGGWSMILKKITFLNIFIRCFWKNADPFRCLRLDTVEKIYIDGPCGYKTVAKIQFIDLLIIRYHVVHLCILYLYLAHLSLTAFVIKRP